VLARGSIELEDYMATLTIEQRNLLKQKTGEPLRLLDPDTNQEYVLLQAQVYEQLRSALTES
jgi:hypothetical protein